MRELENRAQEPSYGNISLIKVAQNDLICSTGCQETPSGTSNHHHQSRPPLLDSQNGPLTQVTKAKVVSNHYSDSVKCFYVFFISNEKQLDSVTGLHSQSPVILWHRPQQSSSNSGSTCRWGGVKLQNFRKRTQSD